MTTIIIIFRVITGGLGTFTANLLTDSTAPSPFHKAYENNVDINSFVKNPSLRLKRFMNEPMSTLFTSTHYPPTTKEFQQCQVCCFIFKLL